jgi:hypothetical protein
MAKPLTDVDTFPASITVPEDGDNLVAGSVETPFQGLSNRTANLNKRVNPEGEYYRCAVLDAAIAASGAVEFPYGTPDGSGFSVLSDELTCPRAGIYLVHFQAQLNYADTTNGVLVTIAINVAGSPVAVACGYRYDTEAALVWVKGSTLVEIATPATDVISFSNNSATYAMSNLSGSLYVVRVGADV